MHLGKPSNDIESGTKLEVLATLEAGTVASLLQKLGIQKDTRILDLGGFNDTCLWTLHLSGYSKLYDISPIHAIYNQPYYTKIRYLFGHEEKTHFPKSFFDIVLCLNRANSAGESEPKFYEASRILRPNGLLIISSDIEQINKLIESANKHSFQLLSEEVRSANPGDSQVSQKENMSYSNTSVLLCFKKLGEDSAKLPSQISILSYSDEKGGISEYVEVLSGRLKSEWQMDVQIARDSKEVLFDTVIVEYSRGLGRAERLIHDVDYLRSQNKTVIIENHDTISKLTVGERIRLQNEATLTYKANEIGERDKIEKYYLYPHISYMNVPLQPYENRDKICLGTFGFAFNYKNLDEIAWLAKKLKVKAKLLISINQEVGREEGQEVIRKLKRIKWLHVFQREESSRIAAENGIIAKIGFFTLQEVVEELKGCSHIVFAHGSGPSNSGVMTFAKRLSRPIVATDSFQARQAQVIRVGVFSKFLVFQKKIKSLMVGLTRGQRPNFVEFIRETYNLVADRTTRISLLFLKEHSEELARDEDGLPYLVAILQSLAAQ